MISHIWQGIMLSREEIKKLAELARIYLTEAEEKKLAGDLASILGYIEKLKEVDVNGVPEMSHAVDIRNVFREDAGPADSKSSQAGKNDALLIEQFPEEERGYLKVKGVFERD